MKKTIILALLLAALGGTAFGQGTPPGAYQSPAPGASGGGISSVSSLPSPNTCTGNGSIQVTGTQTIYDCVNGVYTLRTPVGWHRMGTIIGPADTTLLLDQNNVSEFRELLDTTCPLLTNLQTGQKCFRHWGTAGFSAGGVRYYESPAEDPFAIVISPTESPTSHAHISVTKCGSTYFLTATNSLGVSNGIDLYSSASGNQDWVLLQANVVTLGAGGQFDSTNLGNTHLKCTGDLDATSNVYLYYDGNNGTRWLPGVTICSSNCFGGAATWTKSVANPLITETQSVSGCEYRLLNAQVIARCHGEITGTGVLPSDLLPVYRSPTATGTFARTSSVMDLQRATLDEGLQNTVGQIQKPTTIDYNGACYLFYNATPDGGQVGGGTHEKLAIAFTTCAAMATTNGGAVEPDRFSGQEWATINTAYHAPCRGLLIGYGAYSPIVPGAQLFLQDTINASNVSVANISNNSCAPPGVTQTHINPNYTFTGIDFGSAPTLAGTNTFWYMSDVTGNRLDLLFGKVDANSHQFLTISAPYWLTGTASNTDETGELAFAGVTTATYTWTGVYATHPECTATPQFDLTATPPRVWITYSTTVSFTINTSAATTGTFSYHCIGRS